MITKFNEFNEGLFSKKHYEDDDIGLKMLTYLNKNDFTLSNTIKSDGYCYEFPFKGDNIKVTDFYIKIAPEIGPNTLLNINNKLVKQIYKKCEEIENKKDKIDKDNKLAKFRNSSISEPVRCTGCGYTHNKGLCPHCGRPSNK